MLTGISDVPLARLCLALIFFAFLPTPDCLAEQGEESLILRDESGNVIFEKPVHNGSRFCIRYTHSVALSPVEDHFVIRDGFMVLDRTVYHDFGAGLPHQPEAGQKMTTKNGQIVISGYERRLARFDLRVGRIAGHTLIFSGDCGSGAPREGVALNTLATPGSAVTFELTASRKI